MEMLDPMDNMDGTTVYEENGNVQISGASSEMTNKAWYAEMDEELQQEWNALVGSKENEEPAVQMKDGKLVNRETMQGVRVGSAGGWTLEVFPGDFVVHR